MVPISSGTEDLLSAGVGFFLLEIHMQLNLLESDLWGSKLNMSKKYLTFISLGQVY